MYRRTIVPAAAVLAAFVAVGCGGHGTDGNSGGHGININTHGGTAAADAEAVAASKPNYVNRDGGIVITTVNGGIELGLVRDTVFMGLSDSVLAKARDDIRRDSAKESGDSSDFGRRISGFVKRTVSKALQTRVRYPVSDIQSAAYRNGAIQFTYRNPHKVTFGDINTNNRSALQDFNPDDAQRFVAAVDSAIAAHR